MTTQRFRRGAAVVETSIMMLVLLPILLYTVFLGDLFKYKLEQQETIITPAWDFTAVPYQVNDFDKAATARAIQRVNRLKFADHSSAYDSFDENADVKEKKHHIAVAAHQCWYGAGARQITCTIDNHLASGAFSVSSGLFYAAFGTAGGLSNCTARLGVFNKFVPQQIFTTASGNGGLGAGSSAPTLMEKTRYSDTTSTLDDLHSNASVDSDQTSSAVAEADQFFFNPANDPDRHVMLQDTWAIAELDEVNPDKGGIDTINNILKKRILPSYILYGGSAQSKAFEKSDTFAKGLVDNGFLDKGVGISLNVPGIGTISTYPATSDGPGDSVVTPAAKFDPNSHDRASGSREQIQRDMWQRRTDSYFGG